MSLTSGKEVSAKGKKLFSRHTHYCADSVEFCPIEGYQEYLAVGTYQLDSSNKTEDEGVYEAKLESGQQAEGTSPEPKNQRLGRLYLEYITQEKTLCVIQEIEMAAILDMKWCHHTFQGKAMLGVVNATGELLLFSLNDNDEKNKQLELKCKYVIDEDCLALSLDWSTGKMETSSPSIVISDSKGKISVVQLTENGELVQSQRFSAHNFEAWISAFDYWAPNMILTGGDDCKLKMFDIRSGDAMQIYCKKHDMGVTSLHSSSHKEHLIASGSYDENVSLWDGRHMKRPLTTVGMGGGVWRLKWEPHGKDLLLCACMHNGFHVLSTQDITSNDPKIVVSFEDHQSLAYGVDWYHGQDIEENIVASGSFYDKLLCLWAFE
ncbi:diphthine methyltransferase isoform X2 [Oratosquilla oratoria]|uniref:diphthine methyltransferase isoform X2 n=1 Tax=Oratosquilla oratoria TaxID=337810 RepID=UPI003F772C04